MKKATKFTIFLVIACVFLNTISFAYKEIIFRNYDNKPVRVIKVILDWEHYIVSSIAEDGGETLENLTKKVGWDTSINWVFFCPDDYSQCEVTSTISERIYLWEWEKYSKYRWDTWIRGIFGFNKNWKPLFVQKNLWYMTGLNINFNEDKIDELFFWLWNFPILLYNGENVLRWSEIEMDHKIRASWSKQFICSDQTNNIIYMWVVAGVTVYELTDLIKKYFDCYNAILLDAGLSAGMIYDWKVLKRWTRRNIMDAFVVLTRKEYNNLTKYNPPYKTKFLPKNAYQLTTQDIRWIAWFEKILRKKIAIRGTSYRRDIIKILRNIISSPNFQAEDIQKKLTELILRIYTIDHL